MTDTTHERPQWTILVVMIVAEVMDLMASTIVNVCGPDLINSLSATPAQMQWVIGGYALTLGAGLVLGGRLGDRFGRRAMFLGGLAAFTLASLLCALAASIESLIVFRLVQGLAGAILLPQGLGLLRENFSGPDLAKAFGIFGPILGLAGIVGPVLGGLLIADYPLSLGWRTVFLINVPVGLVTLVLAYRKLPHRAGDATISIDLPGALCLMAASALLVLPLAQAESWSLWQSVCLSAALLALALFVLRQRAVLAAGRSPLVMPAIFQQPAYAAGLLGIALFFCSLIGFQLVLTLFLQIGHHYTPALAGVASAPFAIGIAMGATLSGMTLAERLGRKVLLLGAAIELLGLGLLSLSLAQTSSFSTWQIVPGTLVIGFGAGLVIAALFSIILAALNEQQIGSGSGVLSAVQSLAASIAVAIFSALFFTANPSPSVSPETAMNHTLLAQAVILLVFMAVTFMLPATSVNPREAVDVQ